ncbi:Zinc/iron permease [Piromyces finnis]|uniref:Zinc/iron permease n=1 Tax=Piromyces finnis TaxID=1754191 RepID=A0A1Y1VHB0_9FUNG|nr:Zinc/iron permease [Piromyces finnis]|eukprot:ORX56106.1 Zinc/iron permease [Piromyces finnis]
MDGSSYEQALILAAIAGFSTFIGAVLPLLNFKIKKSIKKISYLVFTLSLAAGVMTYISLVEMMPEAVNQFKSTELPLNINPVFAQSLFFFIGILLCIVFDYIIEHVSGKNNHFDMADDLENIKYEVEENIENTNKLNNGINPSHPDTEVTICIDDIKEDDKRNLKYLGFLTAFAITFHNIPEGVATFSSAVSNTKTGIMLTVAISIHNIPEGLSVAFPIYFSTGNKVKAFLWGAFSGVAEPLAALTEYLILKIFKIENTDFSPFSHGIIFAVVAGVMTYISLCELLPTARKFDNSGSITMKGFIIGMAIMAISLVLLDIF